MMKLGLTANDSRKYEDYDFHITPTILFSCPPRVNTWKAYGLGLSWGFWFISINFYKR